MVVAATALAVAVAAAVSTLSFSLLYSFALALHLFFSFVFFFSHCMRTLAFNAAVLIRRQNMLFRYFILYLYVYIFISFGNFSVVTFSSACFN